MTVSEQGYKKIQHSPRRLYKAKGMPDRGSNDSDRRTFIKRGLLARRLAGAARRRRCQLRRRAGVGGVHRSRSARSGRRAPNILVILVDQLRTPAWVPRGGRARRAAAEHRFAAARVGHFEGHYAASNDCSPSRGTLLTGLVTHQTGCMITGRSRLEPGIPDVGHAAQGHGLPDHVVGEVASEPPPERLRSSRTASREGPIPRPTAEPGQGTEVDPAIVDSVRRVVRPRKAGNGPWCTTVSLVNPHDVAWWYRFTSEVPQEAETAAGGWGEIPAELRDPEQLHAHGKPLLHRSLQETAGTLIRRRAVRGAGNGRGAWSGLMNTYLLLQAYVDRQIGRVLREARAPVPP